MLNFVRLEGSHLEEIRGNIIKGKKWSSEHTQDI